jgi:1-acyl-sn-glycerol-3-phosphate acyltransferase
MLVKRDDPGETWVVLFPEGNRLGSWGVGGFITGLQMVDVSGLLESGLLTGIRWRRQLGVGGIGHLRVRFLG